MKGLVMLTLLIKFVLAVGIASILLFLSFDVD